MNKSLKISLIIIGALILIAAIVAFLGWMIFKSRLLSFENEYEESKDIPELTIDGYTFPDRNRNGALDVYEDARQPVEKRVEDVLAQMTMDEKVHLLKGSGLRSAMGRDPEGIPGAVGTIVPTPRLGIPTIYLSDGPAGLRIEPTREGEDRTYYCTAFPIATLIASTWNEDLALEVGNAMGIEAKEYGIDVILGPGANIHRNPLCGRNFEYFSEDPVLTGTIGAAIINGIESNGIGTSVKHYVANNQETRRNVNDVRISERAMREIYLKGFEIIVKESQPWTIMSSYNKVNGTYVSQNKYLLTDVLRGDWGFEGLVMTDWFGGVDAVAQINAGNDLLEPGTNPQWKALKKGAESGELLEENINTSVRRILTLIFNSQKIKGYDYGNNPDLEKHAEITRKSASEGMVLLKNNGTLPFDNVQNIALIGVTSYNFIAGGTGSGDVNEAYTVSLEEGLTNSGYIINEIPKKAYEVHKAENEDEFEEVEGIQAMFNPFDPPEFMLTDEQLDQTASTADIAIVTIGRNSGEGFDRVEEDDFLLTEFEQDMISKTCEVFHNSGKKVIVVMNIGGVIETASWKEQPDAILLAWQGGQEGGNSVVDILKGVVNPSGKLPMTFPVHLSDHASTANFPLDGEEISVWDLIRDPDEKPEEELEKNKDFTNYEEGIYVGYRHFDKKEIDVSYPFGYGLSYTQFEYSALEIENTNDTISASFTITNTGSLPGKEVIQLYTAKNDTKIDRPVRELRDYTKTTEISEGDSISVELVIPLRDLSYWNEDNATWELENGTYTIQVGASSRDIRLSGEIVVEN